MRMPEDQPLPEFVPPEFEDLVTLHRVGILEWPGIPELAHRWLEVLQSEGLSEPLPERSPSGGFLIVPTAAVYMSAPLDKPPFYDTHSVRLHNDQVLWLRITLQEVTVLDKPLRRDSAILAALTVLESRPIDIQRLRKALPRVPDFRFETLQYLYERWTQLPRGEGYENHEALAEDVKESCQAAEEGEFEFYENLQLRSVCYATALIRYYRPEFDGYPRAKQIALVEGFCERLNRFLKATRQLLDFLEYGDPERDLRPGIDNVKRDVRAAVLKDVEGLSYQKIGERLGLRRSESDAQKGDNPNARQSVARGRRILATALGGEKGWQKHAQAMRAERDR